MEAGTVAASWRGERQRSPVIVVSGNDGGFPLHLFRLGPWPPYGRGTVAAVREMASAVVSEGGTHGTRSPGAVVNARSMDRSAALEIAGSSSLQFIGRTDGGGSQIS
jgi:hypothetical protein